MAQLHLQPITGEFPTSASANFQDGARLDLVADGFWGSRFERAFFDLKVFNPYPPQIDDLNLLPATVRMRSQRSEPTCKGSSKLNMTPSPPYLLCYRRLRKRDHSCIQMHCCPAVSKMGPHIVQPWPEFVVIFPSPSYTPLSCASEGLDHQWAMLSNTLLLT